MKKQSILVRDDLYHYGCFAPFCVKAKKLFGSASGSPPVDALIGGRQRGAVYRVTVECVGVDKENGPELYDYQSRECRQYSEDLARAELKQSGRNLKKTWPGRWALFKRVILEHEVARRKHALALKWFQEQPVAPLK